MARRSHGTGSLTIRHGKWFGQWRTPSGKTTSKVLGPVRNPGTREGLTRVQAETALRKAIVATPIARAVQGERLTVEQAGTRLLAVLKAKGAKRSTQEGYESALRVHLAPAFPQSIDKVTTADVERHIAKRLDAGAAAKSVLNEIGFLHSVFEYACSPKRGWASSNPVKAAEKPRPADVDADIRFLDQTELEAVIAAVPDDVLGPTERVLYLTAAMAGLRQGELIALRWRDVDWIASKLRVRQNYVRGEFGTPKSKRSSRAVPLAQRVAQQLELHFQRSAYQGDGDLVFCHPQTGNPLDPSPVLKRFKAAMRRAGLGDRLGNGGINFHSLRHTFGTRMAAAGVPMRTLQEWMGHRDFKTTLIYADYMPGEQESQLVDRAFAPPAPEVPALLAQGLAQDSGSVR